MTKKKFQGDEINLSPEGNSTMYEKISNMDKRSKQHRRKIQQGN